MKITSIITAAALSLIGSLTIDVVHSHQLPATGSAHSATQGETVTVAADQPIPNLPGKRLVSLIVDYAPDGSTAAHRHPGSAFIYAYVLSGEIRSQVDDEPARVYRAGEAWFENPGAHHRVSANASKTKPARLLAVFIVDAADDQLVSSDNHEQVERR